MAVLLQRSIETVKDNRNSFFGFDTSDGRYTKVVLYWVGKISLDGFVYAIRNVIEDAIVDYDTRKYDKMIECFNEFVREIAIRSENEQAVKM